MTVRRATTRTTKRVVKKSLKKTTKKAAKMAAVYELRAFPSRYGADPKTGLITPKRSQAPVPPSKLKKGLQDARRLIDDAIADIIAPSDDYDIKAIELSLTFGVKGEFLGFGGSGATTVKVTIGPPSKAQGS